ncbi:signal peptidase I [Microbacterium sp. gxy059]|uniref:signal peptidase I n=1 Tax=Microbacterium sp. gxy059 TaxID=2957199 RepID=UPI003D97748C
MLRRALGTAVTTILVVTASSVVLWYLFSALTGATLITFRTGSMSPTMPQGAVAVAFPISAADIRVGDVVTVSQGEGSLPVTHRVVEVRDDAEATSADPLPEGGRELVMRGDDNDAVDLHPYVVTEARRVAVAVPHVGAALMVLQSPLGMGAMTLVAGALTAWAFWPRRPDEDDDEDEEPQDPAPAAASPGPLTRREHRALLEGSRR